MTTRKPADKRLLFLPLLLGLVCYTAWLVYQPSTVKPVKVVTVAVEDTEHINGLFYLAGEKDPFSGEVVERYEDGSLKARSLIRDGLLHGLSEGWFANGVRQVKEPFEKGLSHGRRLKWYSSGALKSEEEIVDGNLEGSFLEWHENGQLAKQIPLSAGVAHGVSRAWFPSGYLKARVALVRGEVVQQRFFTDGELKGLDGVHTLRRTSAPAASARGMTESLRNEG